MQAAGQFDVAVRDALDASAAQVQHLDPLVDPVMRAAFGDGPRLGASGQGLAVGGERQQQDGDNSNSRECASRQTAQDQKIAIARLRGGGTRIFRFPSRENSQVHDRSFG
jgi:hypothetical protein